jgi:hypothetical protein
VGAGGGPLAIAPGAWGVRSPPRTANRIGTVFRMFVRNFRLLPGARIDARVYMIYNSRNTL